LKSLWHDEVEAFARLRWQKDISISNAELAREFFAERNPGNVEVRTIEAFLGKIRLRVLDSLSAQDG
jgi:hypothetical protein